MKERPRERERARARARARVCVCARGVWAHRRSSLRARDNLARAFLHARLAYNARTRTSTGTFRHVNTRISARQYVNTRNATRTHTYTLYSPLARCRSNPLSRMNAQVHGSAYIKVDTVGPRLIAYPRMYPCLFAFHSNPMAPAHHPVATTAALCTHQPLRPRETPPC